MLISTSLKITEQGLWSYGFRPFFLLGSLFAALSILLWLPQFYSRLELSTLFAPVDWHIHEIFFGYIAAIIAGFLLTAIPNWTGRSPIHGATLVGLVLLWLSGRVAIGLSSWIGWFIAMAIDLSFLATLIFIALREIISVKNWHNLKILFFVSVLLISNATFHIEAHYQGISDVSRRFAMTAVLTLIMIIGGRIIPIFTRNYLLKKQEAKMPAAFNFMDVIAIVIAAAALVLWTFDSENRFNGILFAIAAIVHLIRVCRWAGHRTLHNPLITILHVGYLFIPAGFGLLALFYLQPKLIAETAGIHALGVGAVGTMTLSVMVRATLGHTGRALIASKSSLFMFACILIAAITRIFAALNLGDYDTLLHVAAFFWLMAFAGFGILFARVLTEPHKTSGQ